MLRIGHRGAAGYEPENTLKSFSKALELKVDMVEFDVYVCKTGEVVVIHDHKVNRTTNGRGSVADKTLTDLKELDAGKGEKIPTLEEVLNLIDRRAQVNIELKGPATAAAVAKIIDHYVKNRSWKFADFLVSSFNHWELDHFKQLSPEIRRGALITGIPKDLTAFGQNLGAFSVNLSLEFINQQMVEDAHQRGLKVLVWTVNDKDDIERMKALGVDGIFSNFPDRL